MTKTNHTNPDQLALPLTTPVLAPTPKGADHPDREARLDAARAVLARGVSGVRDDPQALAAYLAFRARFRGYSARNTMLIWMQRPAARYCMGFRAWTTHGRRVRKGERGLMILAPILRRPTDIEIAAGHDPDTRVPVGFRTTTTFDYEQTVATRDDALTYVPPTPRLEADGPEGLVARLEAAAERAGCRVHYTSLGYADGWYREADRTIAVRASLSGADRASVLCHELAHAVAHAGGAPTAEAVLTSQSRASKELQAEGAAYVALAALGLDTARATLPYLRGWACGDDDALAAELDAIDRIAARVLALADEATR
ncbi:MAG TPA: ImmA/IrrE family metallo-endopeptidase [Gemmatimonadetes bacterium]|nr:ImmA/IrrE family metallo-endopeptidase [Gemmatimonadota bacterium]